jgi:hypothetical protein
MRPEWKENNTVKSTIMNKSTQKKDVAGQTVFRQGDVMLVRIDALPGGVKKMRVRGDRIILALGEATGHHHSIAKKKGRLYEVPGQATIVEVATALAELEHQEHDALPLPRGFYRVELQREYHPEAIRRVAD